MKLEDGRVRGQLIGGLDLGRQRAIDGDKANITDTVPGDGLEIGLHLLADGAIIGKDKDTDGLAPVQEGMEQDGIDLRGLRLGEAGGELLELGIALLQIEEDGGVGDDEGGDVVPAGGEIEVGGLAGGGGEETAGLGE